MELSGIAYQGKLCEMTVACRNKPAFALALGKKALKALGVKALP